MRDRTFGSRSFVAGLLAVLLAATAVGAAERPRREARGAAGVVTIRMVDDRFQGGTITIERGTVVSWRNVGDNIHTTTSDSGIWGRSLDPGEAFRRRFRRVGTFPYHCVLHPAMRGTITVTRPSADVQG